MVAPYFRCEKVRCMPSCSGRLRFRIADVVSYFSDDFSLSAIVFLTLSTLGLMT